MLSMVGVSDLHLDACTAGVPRHEECAAALDRAAQHAIDTEADVFFFAGDLCDPDAGSIGYACTERMLRAATKLDAAAIDVILVAGNHDVIEDGSGNTTLSPLRALAQHPGSSVSVVEGPRLISSTSSVKAREVKEGAGPVRPRIDVDFLCLPYPSRARDYAPARVVNELAYKSQKPLVVIAHLMVPGIGPGSESTDMARGRDVWLPIAELRDVAKRRPLLVVQGHYHTRMTFNAEGVLVHVVGSPARLTFGEQDNPDPAIFVAEVT